MANCAAGADVTRVWDLGVRVFHWLVVATVATALVTGLSGPRNVLNIHIAAGAVIGGLVAFRILWGLVGSTYARFSSFPVQRVAINEDLAGLVAGRRPRYLGHNPLGSLMALALLAILSLSVMTGVVTLGGVDKQGPLAFVTSYNAGKAAQGLHQALAYVLLALIGGHLLGVAYEFVHGQPDLIRCHADRQEGRFRRRSSGEAGKSKTAARWALCSAPADRRRSSDRGAVGAPGVGRAGRSARSDLCARMRKLPYGVSAESRPECALDRNPGQSLRSFRRGRESQARCRRPKSALT